MMKLPRRNFLHLAAGAAALPAVSRIARAESYPTRPVRIVVGFPPACVSNDSTFLLPNVMSPNCVRDLRYGLVGESASLPLLLAEIGADEIAPSLATEHRR